MSDFEFAEPVLVSNIDSFNEIINDSLNRHIAASDETIGIINILKKKQNISNILIFENI
jgi:hypothetical protein